MSSSNSTNFSCKFPFSSSSSVTWFSIWAIFSDNSESDTTLRLLDTWYKLHVMNYSGDLKSDLVWISNGPKQVGLQMVWISNGIWNPEAQPFEIRTNGRHFVKNHLKTGPFEIRPSKSPDFKCFRILNGQVSDPHYIRISLCTFDYLANGSF